MKKWFKWVGITIVAACCALYTRQVFLLFSNNSMDLASATHLFPASIGSYMAAYLAAAMGWQMLLMVVETKANPLLSVGIFTTSQFAKYLPGNIGHHAGRVFLSTKYGYSGSKVVLTMAVELAMVVSAMLLLSLPVLGQWSERFSLASRGAWFAAVLVVLLAALAVALLFFRKRGSPPLFASISESLRQVRAEKLRSAACVFVAFLLINLQILLTVLSLGLLDAGSQLFTIENLSKSVAVFSAAWLVGFLVPGAPAGIGIREMVLTEGLAPLVGRDQAILLAMLFRILTIMADLLAFMTGAWLLWLVRPGR